jgi:hypothetical protein
MLPRAVVVPPPLFFAFRPARKTSGVLADAAVSPLARTATGRLFEIFAL